MTIDVAWRGPFTNAEANALHAEAFGTRVFSADEWDWERLLRDHSLGWVTARDDGALVGLVNVVWDGLVHAWLQDLMVAASHRHQGVGRCAVVGEAAVAQRHVGCHPLDRAALDGGPLGRGGEVPVGPH